MKTLKERKKRIREILRKHQEHGLRYAIEDLDNLFKEVEEENKRTNRSS